MGISSEIFPALLHVGKKFIIKLRAGEQIIKHSNPKERKGRNQTVFCTNFYVEYTYRRQTGGLKMGKRNNSH